VTAGDRARRRAGKAIPAVPYFKSGFHLAGPPHRGCSAAPRPTIRESAGRRARYEQGGAFSAGGSASNGAIANAARRGGLLAGWEELGRPRAGILPRSSLFSARLENAISIFPASYHGKDGPIHIRRIRSS